MRVAPLLLLLALACSREPEVMVDSFEIVARPVAGATAGDGVAARPACPPTGGWTQCAILERLDRAGLAPQLDSTTVATEPPLEARGFVVRLARAEAEVYLYEDYTARRRDELRLEKARYLEYGDAVSMQTIPTLIMNVNAIVVLHSRNDHQRERVGDAITAGPPQKK